MPGGGAPAGAGGSGATGSTASVYNPMAQPQADTLYQQIIQGLQPMALNPALTPAGQNYPTAQQGAGLVSGNPYFDQLTQIANQTVPYGQGLYGSAIGGQGPLADLGQYAMSAMTGIPQQQDWYRAFQTAIESNPFISPTLAGQNQAGAYGASTAAGAYGAGQNSFLDAQSIRSLFPQMTGLGGQVSQLMDPTASLAGQVGSFMGPTAGLAGQVGGLMAPTIGLSGQVAGLAPQVAAPMGSLQGAAGQILNAGFDPQNALYNRTFDQLRNQAAATNAMSGIGNTPYGASVTDKALSDFNINWQNNLLNRMATAGGAAQGLDTAAGGLGQAAGGLLGQAGGLLGQAAGIGNTAGGLYGQAGNLGTAAGNLFGQSANIGGLANSILGQAGNTLGQATNVAQGGLNLGKGATDLLASSSALPLGVYDQWLAQQLQAANAGVGAGATGAGTLGSLGGTLGGALAGQQSLGGAGFQNLMSSLQAPYNAANTQGGNILSAMSNLTNLGNNQFLLPQDVLNNLQSYLKLGQAASGISGTLGNMGQQQLMNSLSGVGSLAGTLFGGGGGGGGLLGSGGLGGLFGGGNTAGVLPGTADILGGNAITGFGGGSTLDALAAGGGALADTGTLAATGGGLDLASALPAAALSG